MESSHLKKTPIICLLLYFLLVISEANIQECKSGQKFTKSDVCYIKKEKNLIHSFSSVQVIFNCSTSECTISTGKTQQDVQKVIPVWYKMVHGMMSMFSSKSTQGKEHGQIMYFSPFTDTYIKVELSSPKPVEFRKNIIVLDSTCIACLISGLILFFSAPKLSSSVKFYYTGGVGIGVLASVLIVIFILSRFVPKKPAAYSILIGGWSFCAWLSQKIWNNWRLLLMDYQMYFLGYLGIAGFTSFALCYWKGPVKDPRTQNIIQWTIQLFATFLLFMSSQSTEVSIAIVSATTSIYYIFFCQHNNVISTLKSYIPKIFWSSEPEPRRFLTEKEYREQGERETKRALEELKQFCNSPQCSPWKTLSRIQSPQKFARFMEGENHVSDAEMTLHDAELTESEAEETSDLMSEDETDLEHVAKINSVETFKFEDDSAVADHFSEDED